MPCSWTMWASNNTTILFALIICDTDMMEWLYHVTSSFIVDYGGVHNTLHFCRTLGSMRRIWILCSRSYLNRLIKNRRSIFLAWILYLKTVQISWLHAVWLTAHNPILPETQIPYSRDNHTSMQSHTISTL
jgi:hypothetical protein